MSNVVNLFAKRTTSGGGGRPPSICPVCHEIHTSVLEEGACRSRLATRKGAVQRAKDNQSVLRSYRIKH